MFKKSTAPAAGGYTLSKSLRFRSSATAYLNRTPASASNRKTYTLSMWVKRGTLGAYGTPFQAWSSGNGSTTFFFLNTDVLQFYSENSATNTMAFTTTQVFRDPAAWYHIIISVDTTQATNTNRVKIYINGSQITAFSTATYPTQNLDTWVNNNNLHGFGENLTNGGDAFDGYMANVQFIDGQQLTPSSFGATDATTGAWQPIAYTGSYGTNGFYLPFTDATSTSTLGNDSSGNSNTWTTNNISVTAGVTYDSMTDVPTLTSATAANYGNLNPLSSGGTISNGNLTYLATSGGNAAFGTYGMSGSDKFYFEVTVDAVSTNANIGIINETFTQFSPSLSLNWGAESVAYRNNGQKYLSGTYSAYGSSYTTNDLIGVAVDCGAGTVTFYKNNVSQGAITSSTINGHTNFAFVGQNTGAVPQYSFNFGQRPFTYSAPSGFVALNTYNL